MNNLASEIDRFMGYCRLNQTQAAAALGVSYPTIISLLRGVDVRTGLEFEPRDSTLRKLAQRMSGAGYPVTFERLRALADIDQGKPVSAPPPLAPSLFDATAILEPSPTRQISQISPTGNITLPVYGVASCGPPSWMPDQPIGYQEWPRSVTNNADAVFEVRGNSMTGAGFRDGDALFARHMNGQPVPSGAIVLAAIDGDFTCKIFRRDRMGDYLEAMPEDRGHSWRIPMTKNGTPQTLPLGSNEIEILKKRRNESESPWVFPSPTSKTGHLQEPRKGWERILKRAGIENLRLHDLRRTLASYMVDTGASLPIIGKALNHQSQQTTAIYARLSLDPVRQAKDKAVQAMLGAIKEGE